MLAAWKPILQGRQASIKRNENNKDNTMLRRAELIQSMQRECQCH